MSQLLDSLLRKNISYYTIPAAWLISFAPHVYAIGVYDQSSPDRKFDRANPRHSVASVAANQALSEDAKAVFVRAEAAQLNGFENLGVFAAAVVAANVARLDVRTVNGWCLWYLLNRVLFNVAYVRGARGHLRGVFFYASLTSVFTLLIKAGNAARRVVV